MKRTLFSRQLVQRISVGIFLLFLLSCYHAKDVISVTSAPVYTMTASGYSSYSYYSGNAGGNPQDSMLNFTVNNGDSLTISFNYMLVSGNPANYWFSLLVDSLPSGITTSRDSSSFRLPYQSKFVLHVNTTDTGYTFVKFRQDNTITGTSIYKFRVHVMPPTPPNPPTDCATCFAAATTGRTSCNADSCGITVSLVPGMLHWVNIANANCLGDSFIVKAYVACDTGILIPLQTVQGYTIYGRSSVVFCGGYFSYPIYDTLVHGGDTVNCIFQVQNF